MSYKIHMGTFIPVTRKELCSERPAKPAQKMLV